MPFHTAPPAPDLSDLDRGDQLDLYNNLLDAVRGALPPAFSRPVGDIRPNDAGVDDVAGWLAEQDRYRVADRLIVARFWGGPALVLEVESRLPLLMEAAA